MSGGSSLVRVLNLNKAVGYASSGVEYAQKYRRELLAGLPDVEDYYVFTDHLGTNPAVFTDRLGFEREQVLWIYHLLSGRPTAPNTLRVEDYLARLGQPHTEPRPVGERLEVEVVDSSVRYLLRTVDDGAGNAMVDTVDTVVGDRLLRAERFDTSVSNVEHFHENCLVRRVFYTADGAAAAEQHLSEGEITRTLIHPPSPLYDAGSAARGAPLVIDGRSRFFQHVFAHLFEPGDVVIVDRALDAIDAVYPVLRGQHLYSVVHAEHFDHKQVEDGVLLWNNHYEHVFARPDLVSGLIVSTHRQQEVLESQLADRGEHARIPVVRIPVGVATVREDRDFVPLTLVTASRLADEKHLDLLVRAVARARQTLPGLRLDIFGEGNRKPVLAAVAETGTADCVTLRGHQPLDGVLGGYALYVSASTSEGFGLSLLEAISEGLPIVGFDVDYGNREMVTPGVNGLLVPHTGIADDDVAALAAAVVELLTSGRLAELRAASLRKAADYGPDRVRERWASLLRAEDPC